MKRQIVCLLAGIVCAALPSQANAQPERYDLGRRIGAFELVWEKTADAEIRKRALNVLQPASMQMLTMQFEEAGRIFDDARRALAVGKQSAAGVAWADSLSVRPFTRLIDAAEPELRFTIQQFYKVQAAPPKDVRLTVQFFVGKPIQIPLAKVPVEGKLPLVGIAEGDQPLFITIRVGDAVVAQSLSKVSVVKNLKSRLEKLKQAVAGFGRGVGTIDQETVREIHQVLEGLANKETREVDYPAAKLLAEAEAAVEAIQAGRRFYGGDKTGQFWLRLPNGKSAVAARLFAPEAVKEKRPLPLVVAVHGVGGSENLFFEAYGAGTVVKLAQERGWLLAAPRGGLLASGYSMADVIDEVAKLYPVDKSKVFAIGYSLGASHAVNSATETPHRVAAVGALGGGTIKAKSDARNIAFFVGVGTNDLSLLPARTLRDKLAKAGATKVDYREYPDLEHFVIVRQALPDVFAMFDKIAKGK